MFEEDYGLRIGRGIGDYIELPAISGMKLKKVSVVDRNAGGVLQIVTAGGAVVKGGKPEECDLMAAAMASVSDYQSYAKNNLITWTLNGTKGNTSYRLSASANATIRIVHLVAEYVDEATPDDDLPPVEDTFKASFPSARFVDSKVLSSLGVAPRYFSISCNKKWSAKVGSETTADGVVLTTASGEGDCPKFEVKCAPNTDFNNRKKIVIEFDVEGMGTRKVEMEQEKGSILGLEFRDQANSGVYWPFNEEITENTTAIDGGVTGTYTVGPYSIPYHGITHTCIESTRGWRLGTGVGNYIQSPVIEGKTLKKIVVYDSNGCPAVVADDTGAAVEFSCDETAVQAVMATYTITSPEAGKAYRFQNTTSKTLRIWFMTFIYE